MLEKFYDHFREIHNKAKFLPQNKLSLFFLEYDNLFKNFLVFESIILEKSSIEQKYEYLIGMYELLYKFVAKYNINIKVNKEYVILKSNLESKGLDKVFITAYNNSIHETKEEVDKLLIINFEYLELKRNNIADINKLTKIITDLKMNMYQDVIKFDKL